MDKRETKYLILIFSLFIAACMETDIFLPAMGDMVQYFGASEEKIQDLLIWNFIGICISGPIYGPLSDSIGRKKPLMISLGLFVLGSLFTLFANDINWMLIGRFLQGLGSGGCLTLATAILFDAFQESQAIKAINQLNMTVPLVIAFAPMLGGLLNYSFGFRANFVAIAISAFFTLIISTLFLEETLVKEKHQPIKIAKILNDFKTVLSNVAFWQLTVFISLIFSAYLAFLSMTAVLFVIELGVTKQLFPFFQSSLLGAWLAANLCFSVALKKIGPQKVKLTGFLSIVVGGLLLLAVSFIDPKNPYLLTASMLPFAFGANWIYGLYFPESMAIFPEIRGAAASLSMSGRLLITSFVIGSTSSFYDGTIYPLVIMVTIVMVLVVPIAISYEKREKIRAKALQKIATL